MDESLAQDGGPIAQNSAIERRVFEQVWELLGKCPCAKCPCAKQLCSELHVGVLNNKCYIILGHSH